MSTQVPNASATEVELEESIPRLLVVDDEPMNLKAMEVALSGLHCEQVQVQSGAAALRELLHGDFSVILLDVQLPEMDGFETAQLIRQRERCRDTPIIFVTAFNQRETDMQMGYKLGAVDYLFKPIVPEVLRAKVTALVELDQRTRKVERQARQLQAMQQAEAEHRLEEERRKWEAEMLRIQNQQLAEADRRKDEFLAVLAHELRNPLAPLSSGLDVLLEGKASPVETERLHEVMARQVRHLTRLVDDLLDVCRISSGKLELHPEPNNLSRLIDHAVDACRARFEAAHQTVHVHGSEEPVLLLVDSIRFVQVMVNLLNNASRYSESGKSIYIEWGRHDDKAFIKVRDEGRGITPAAQQRIFDMFVQEREGGRGLGLGLTLVKQILEMHGGSVSVTSAGRGFGSTFTIEIPCSDAALTEEEIPPSVAVVDERSSPTSDPNPQLRIALIEDDDDIRETMTLLLEQWGHTVEVAVDGEQGVALVQRMRPDVALLDIGMPLLDGLGAAEEICRQMGDERPPLIALSGYGQEKDRARSKEAGFDLHLVKPAEPTALRRALAELCQGRKWPAQSGKKS